MPEQLRALLVILILSSAVFGLARSSAIQLSSSVDFARRRNMWFAITLFAFLAQNVWIYALLSALLLVPKNRREANPVALFFILMFAVPAANFDIPGFGLMNFLLSLTHQRLLSLLILLPAFLSLIRGGNSLPFGRTMPDKLIGMYMLLVVLLALRATSITDTIRLACYQLIDVFLPYFVISRCIRSFSDFREALLAFVLAVLVMALIGIFEIAKSWLLYSSLLASLEVSGMTGYLGRSGFVRAVASAGQPIALGYVIAVAIGFYLFLQQSVSPKRNRLMGLGVLLAGLASALSRGPWVGSAVMLVVFILTGRSAIRRLFMVGLFAAMALLLVPLLPGGERVINLIPFVGETDKGNITYREKLIENSLIVIKRNLWFGSMNYLNTPEMEEMRQGQGIIDIVNTYIQVTLETGIIGLMLFSGFFLSITLGIVRSMKSVENVNDDLFQLGRSLLATLLGALCIIGTVSSITVVPIVYWSLAGLGAAYIALVQSNKLKE